MKKLILIFIGCLPFGLLAQNDISISKNIQSLKVSAGIEVELFNGAKANKIEADERVMEAINYKVDGYELKLGLPIGSIIDGDFPLKVKVYIKNIDRINAVQGSIVEIQNKVKNSNFFIRATEGSVVSGGFDTKTLELKALSGGIIDIRGESESQVVLVNTGGKYNGRNLKTENTEVKISYGGTAQVYATENCEANIVVGGTIDVFGQPKYMNKKTSFGGNINLIKD